MILGGLDHDELTGFYLIRNRRAIDLEEEIERFYLSVVQNDSVRLKGHLRLKNSSVVTETRIEPRFDGLRHRRLNLNLIFIISPSEAHHILLDKI